jgi:hypothetical protein
MFDKIKNAMKGGNVGGDGGEFGAYGKYLEGLNFPASKDEVLLHLQEKGASDSLIEHVNSLSGDRFDEARDIFKGIMPH